MSSFSTRKPTKTRSREPSTSKAKASASRNTPTPTKLNKTDSNRSLVLSSQDVFATALFKHKTRENAQLRHKSSQQDSLLSLVNVVESAHNQLSSSLRTLGEAQQDYERKTQTLSETLRAAQAAQGHLNESTSTFNSRLERVRDEINEVLTGILNDYAVKIAAMESSIEEKSRREEASIMIENKLEECTKILEQDVAKLKKELDVKEAKRKELAKTCTRLQNTVDTLEKSKQEKDSLITELYNKLETYQKMEKPFKMMKMAQNDTTKRLNEFTSQMAEKDALLEKQRQMISALSEKVDSLLKTKRVRSSVRITDSTLDSVIPPRSPKSKKWSPSVDISMDSSWDLEKYLYELSLLHEDKPTREKAIGASTSSLTRA